MNTIYPHRHLFYAHGQLGIAVAPICAYCLHRLGQGSTTGPLSAAERRSLEDEHVCLEKTTARRAEVSLPYN
jgi:hypothetical protein